MSAAPLVLRSIRALLASTFSFERFENPRTPLTTRRLALEWLEDRRLLAPIAPVGDSSPFPYRAAVQIAAVWDTNHDRKIDASDRIFTGSGALISDYHVLTAAHVIWDASLGGYADFVYVHAGRDGEFNRPYGEARATRLAVPSSYSDGVENDDIGVITLDRNLGAFTGHFGLTHVTPSPQRNAQAATYHFNLLHYPGENPYTGEDLYYSDADYTVWTPGTGEPTSPFYNPFPPTRPFDIPEDKIITYHGSSGGPLYLDDHSIVGLVTGELSGGYPWWMRPLGYPRSYQYDFFVRFDNASLAFINQEMGRSPAPTDRPALVDSGEWFSGSPSVLTSVDRNPGDTVTALAQVFNAGTARASNVKVRFRLSSDNQYDTGDTFIADVVIPSIAPFKTATAALSAPLPNIAPGTRTIVWSVDPDNTVSEFGTPLHAYYHGDADTSFSPIQVRSRDDSREPNDTRSAADPLAANALVAGLVQYDEDWYSITVPAGRERITIMADFNHDAGDIDLRLYDSAGTKLAASFGVTNTERIDYLAPSAGNYSIQVYGNNQGNKYSLKWMHQGVPDLAGASFSAPASALGGQDLLLAFRVKNEGNGDAGPFTAQFYVSRDPDIDPSSDHWVGSYEFQGGIAAGSTSSLRSTKVYLPPAGYSFWNGDGSYYLGMVVDGNHRVAEHDEADNSNVGSGFDLGSIAMTIHRPGTFAVMETHPNRISVPPFDKAMGTLERVLVVATATGQTDTAYSPLPPPVSPHLHIVSMPPVGPFVYPLTYASPIPAIGTHLHPLVPVQLVYEFTGSELAAFLTNQSQTWAMQPGVTSVDASHHHTVSNVSFEVSTYYFFDPPEPDLFGLSLERIDPASQAFGGENVDLRFRVENGGEKASQPTWVYFYISEDPTITTGDFLVGVERLGALAVGESALMEPRVVLPAPYETFWKGDTTYYLGARIDPDTASGEVATSNNSNRGEGIDVVSLEVQAHRPGTRTFWMEGGFDLTFPTFDPALGILTGVRVEAEMQGITASAQVPHDDPLNLHTHLLQFSMGPLDFVGVAGPGPLVDGHELNFFVEATREFSAAHGDLALYPAGQTLTPTGTIITETSWGHSHEVGPSPSQWSSALVRFDFTPAADLQAASFGVASPSAGSSDHVSGETLEVSFSIGNLGSADAEEFEVHFYLSPDDEITSADFLLGTYHAEALAAGAGTGALSASIALPVVDDPFWENGVDFTIGMVLSPLGEVAEIDRGNNANLGVGMDKAAVRIVAPLAAAPVDLGAVRWEAIDGVTAPAGGQWYRLETTRRGPLAATAHSVAGAPVSLSLYNVNDELLDRSTSDQGTARVDRDVMPGEVYYLRIVSDGPIDLRVSHLIEVDGAVITVQGTDGNDELLLTASPDPQLVLNGIGHRLDGLDGKSLHFFGGAGDDSFSLTSTAAALMATGAIQFDGGAGTNSALLNGTAAAETATLAADHASLARIGFVANVANAARIALQGGEGDDLGLVTSRIGDAVVAGPEGILLSGASQAGPPYFHWLDDFEVLSATFAGQAGQRLFFDLLDEVPSQTVVRLIAPDGTEAFRASDANDEGLLVLPESGDYSFAFENATGPVDVSFQLNDSVWWHDGTLELAGTDEDDTVVLGVDGQNLTLVASFVAGQTDFPLAEVRQINVALFDGNDRLTTDPAITVSILADGGSGADVLQTGSGGDLLLGGEGNDELHGGDGDDWLYGEFGDDLLFGGAGIDRMYGQLGNDSLFGGPDRDVMSGQGGHDRVDGEDGPDLVYGNGGHDILYGREGNDRLYGHEGHDILVGGGGSDRLVGSTDRDVIIGGDGADTVLGLADEDAIVGGPTAFDDDLDALVALRAAWIGADPVDVRIQRLTQGFGPGEIYWLTADTAFADNVPDNLAGNGGADWYLADAADLITTGGGDRVTRFS